MGSRFSFEPTYQGNPAEDARNIDFRCYLRSGSRLLGISDLGDLSRVCIRTSDEFYLSCISVSAVLRKNCAI